jgi:hypothetical protein
MRKGATMSEIRPARASVWNALLPLAGVAILVLIAHCAAWVVGLL